MFLTKNKFETIHLLQIRYIIINMHFPLEMEEIEVRSVILNQDTVAPLGALRCFQVCHRVPRNVSTFRGSIMKRKNRVVGKRLLNI